MKISGFTFIRNAIKFDYPVVESIQSILPVCDEVVVAVGNCDDGTRSLIEAMGSSKIKIVDTTWDESLRKGGEVLAVETNKAFDQVSKESDWAFYIQGDEVIHERYLTTIWRAMENYLNDQRIEGLLLRYKHFYGSYDYVGDSRQWYRNEVRIIRNDKSIRSYRDAQGFRKLDKPLMVAPVDAEVYHYGWVKTPESIQRKLESFHRLWHDEEWIRKNLPQVEAFDYSTIDSLQHFDGTHPAVMLHRVHTKNWQFSFDPTKRNFSLKARLLHAIEKQTGWRIGEYRNYKIAR